MANIQDMNVCGNSPLEVDKRDNVKRDSSLVNAVVQEVLKAMKGKAPLEENTNTSHGSGNAINFAGNIALMSHDLNTRTKHCTWIVDSSATDHVTYNRECFSDFRK